MAKHKHTNLRSRKPEGDYNSAIFVLDRALAMVAKYEAENRDGNHEFLRAIAAVRFSKLSQERLKDFISSTNEGTDDEDTYGYDLRALCGRMYLAGRCSAAADLLG